MFVFRFAEYIVNGVSWFDALSPIYGSFASLPVVHSLLFVRYMVRHGHFPGLVFTQGFFCGM